MKDSFKFQLECPRRWWEFDKTEDPSIRYCSACEKLVYRVKDRITLLERVTRQQCVLISKLDWARIQQGSDKSQLVLQEKLFKR